jgi:hypothetical protein
MDFILLDVSGTLTEKPDFIWISYAGRERNINAKTRFHMEFILLNVSGTLTQKPDFIWISYCWT